MFNKEKRQQAKATKEFLKAEIKPRDTYAQRMENKAKRKGREEVVDQRERPIVERLKAIHAGNSPGDVAQMGSELLYVGQLGSVQFQVQDQFSIPEKVMTRWLVYARHDQEFLGMAPTGREVSFSGVTISYFSGTGGTGVAGNVEGPQEMAVTQEYHYWDMVALLQQIQAP